MPVHQISRPTKKFKSKHFNEINWTFGRMYLTKWSSEDCLREDRILKMSKLNSDNKKMLHFSLEYRLKNLQTKTSPADSKNVVTISTGSSAMRLNNNNSNSSNNNTDEISGKQRITSTITTVTPKVMTTSNGTSTINLSGPVTDL